MTSTPLQLLEEPQLEFAHDQCEEHPKDGLFLYGPPPSPSKKGVLRYALIGTAAGAKLFKEWEQQIQKYVPPYKADVAHHSAFPGFQATFGMSWPEAPVASITIAAEKLQSAIRIDHRHEAIKKTVDVYAHAIEEFLNQDADVTPDFWYVVVPDEIYRWGRTKSTPPTVERVAGESTLPKKTVKALLKQPSIFEEENEEAELQLCGQRQLERQARCATRRQQCRAREPYGQSGASDLRDGSQEGARAARARVQRHGATRCR